MLDYLLQLFFQQVFLVTLCLIVWALIRSNLDNRFGWLIAGFWLICTISLLASTTKRHFFQSTDAIIPVSTEARSASGTEGEDMVDQLLQGDSQSIAEAIQPEPQLPNLFGKKYLEFFDAQVIDVVNGDTLVVNSGDDEQFTVRLAAIDAPEMDQPYAERAKDLLADVVANEHVLVLKTMDDEDSNQIFGWIVKGELIVNEYLVQRGYAWYDYRQMEDSTLAKLQDRAKRQRLNIWSVPNPVPPWLWKAPLTPGT